MDVTALPFNQLIGLARTSGTLSLPSDRRYSNHLGTVHAGALLAVAEATSGDFLAREFADLQGRVLPVVRRLEAKFRKPALGAIRGEARVDPAKLVEFRSTLLARGRALLEVAVEVHDEHGTLALTAAVEWFVAREA